MAVSGCPMRKGRSKRTKLAYTNSSTMTGIALLLPLRRALPGPWHNYAPSWDSWGAQQVPALENGTAGTAVIVHIHLTGWGGLLDQIRRAIAVKIGHRDYLPVGGVDATTEAGPTYKRGPAVIVYIDLMRLGVLIDQTHQVN